MYMKKFDIAIIGGDKRTACMAQIFSEKGYRVITYGTVKIPYNSHLYRAETFQEIIDSAAVLVFGIPLQQEGCLFFQEDVPKVTLTELQRCLRKHHKVFGGVIPENFKRHCEKREISCYDFMKDESLTIFNAIATAEGAILEALLHKDTNLHHSNCLVTGYGRCGKVLSDKLRGLHAEVTVCSEDRQELALADSLGMGTIPLSCLKDEAGRFEYLFNTIPAVVLREECLKKLDSHSLIIDIASNQGGVDREAAARHGIPVYHCPGLPGKYAGYSSAGKLADYIVGKISTQS